MAQNLKIPFLTDVPGIAYPLINQLQNGNEAD